MPHGFIKPVDPSRKWELMFRSCFRPENIYTPGEKPTEALLMGIERVLKFKNMLETLEVPGIKGAIPHYFQVRSWDIKMCQNLHHIIGADLFASNWAYILGTLRPEILTYYLVTNNVRRGGKTFEYAAFAAGQLLFSPPGFTIRHFAGSGSQASTVLIYMRSILNRFPGEMKFTQDKITYKSSGEYQGEPSQIITNALTENRRGETAHQVSVDEHHLIDTNLFAGVLMGMTMAPDVTMSLFSTRRQSDIKGLEDYADKFKGKRDPRIIRHSTEGICPWCITYVPAEKQSQCDHTSHEGGNRSQEDKAETIRQIIASLGIDVSLYAQEGNNILFDTAARVFQPNYVDQAMRKVEHPTNFIPPPLYRLDVGFDPNGGSQDNFGIFATGQRVDGILEICGIGCFAVRAMTDELPTHSYNFLKELQHTFQGVPIVVEYEAQPAGWALTVYQFLGKMKNVYFLCRPTDGNNLGVGIPMGSIPAKKEVMANTASSEIKRMRMNPKVVLMTNYKSLTISGEITARSSKEEFILAKTEQELKAARVIIDPITRKVTVSGKMGNRSDDIFCALLHSTNIERLLNNLDILGVLVRATYRSDVHMPEPIEVNGKLHRLLLNDTVKMV